MNSEVHFDILNDEEEYRRVQREAQEQKESRIADEASEAVSFMRHPFWQKIKTDLEEVKQRIINKILKDESMTKEQIDRYRIEADNINLFLNHPNLYVKKLQDLLAKKRVKGGILRWLKKPQPK